MDKIKSTFELSPQAKHRLAMLKADMRIKGLPATEAAIVEALVMYSTDGYVLKALKSTLE